MAELTDEDAEAVRPWRKGHQFDHVSTAGGDTAGFGDRQDVWERNGTLVRLTRERSQWWYDISRTGTDDWLDADEVTAAMRNKRTAPVERVQVVAASINDRVFGALRTTVRHSP
jgi:hypothetical protein